MNGRGSAPDNKVVQLRQAPAPIEPFEPFYVSQLEGYVPKAREWLVDGILMRRTVTLFAGPPKIGKSLLLQQLLTSVASGIPWLTHHAQQCRSFGLFTEDPQDELCRRQIAIDEHYDRSPADFELDMSWEAREGKEALLVEYEKFSDRPNFTPLWYQFWGFCEEMGAEAIGIDTAAVVFGGNENFRGQVTNFMRELVKQAVRLNAAICMTAHPSKTGANSYSGSTAWLGSARFAMSLGRPNDYDEDNGPHNLRVLRGLGANYSPSGLMNERLEYRDGVFVTSEPEERQPSRAPLNSVERADLEYRVLDGVKKVMANGAKLPADDMAAGSIPARCRRSANPLLNRIPLNDLYAAQAALIESGRLVRVSVNRKCLLRPEGGPYYDGEQPWINLTTPPAAS